MLNNAPILAHYDSNAEIKVITDASPTGLGAVLVQGRSEKPVMYISRSLTDSERNYSQIEREGLCIVFAFDRLRKFLLGRQFKHVTDNKPLASIVSNKLPALAASRIQRWLLKLNEFNYEVEIRRSGQIPVADWLSRLSKVIRNTMKKEDETTICFQQSFEKLSAVTSKTVANETARDPILSLAIKYIHNGWPNKVPENMQSLKSKEAELTVEAGCILWGLRVVIPKKLQPMVLAELLVGHQGMVRMKQLARSYVWWYNIDKYIEHEVRQCTGCMQKRAEPAKTYIHPWEFPKTPWQRLHIDFADPIKGMSYFVLIDSYSKWIEVIPMKTTISSRVIEALISLFARYGIPMQVVSDNVPQFTCNEFQQFLKPYAVKHILTAPYHPATNGAAERTVGILKSAMKAAGDNFNLHNFLMANRNTMQATTGRRSPAELLIGRPLRTRLDLLRTNLQEEVQQKQDYMTRNRRQRHREFQERDKVLTRDYRGIDKWQEGVIIEKLGEKHYKVQPWRSLSQAYS